MQNNQFGQDMNAYNQRFNNKIPPPNYMVWAILSTLFCCLPLGIVSIVKASEVNTKWMMGDEIGARMSSEQAKNWAIAAAVIGFVIEPITVISCLLG